MNAEAKAVQLRDRCVVCGTLTSYSRQESVHRRLGYVEGAGQLCRRCWTAITIEARQGAFPRVIG
jgi:hypothetical protein